jgi:hypothetical protein
MQYYHQIRQVLTRVTAPQRRCEVGTRAQAPDRPSERQLAIMRGLEANPSGRVAAKSRPASLRWHLTANDGPALARRPPQKEPALEALILARVAPPPAGDPISDQKCLNGRLTDIRQHVQSQGHAVSQPVISRLLRAQQYRGRANVKPTSGSAQPDRDIQFCYIQTQRTAHQAVGQSVISAATKKKELGGNCKNRGRVWGHSAELVAAHDLPQDAVGRAIP